MNLDNFETYLDCYCRNYRVSREEAMQHAIVKEAKKYFEGKLPSRPIQEIMDGKRFNIGGKKCGD